ncbi:class I SAM-dependent methyltransferase [Chloroflexota bacterium]
MENRELSSSKYDSETEGVYFDLQASWGITKHLGGLNATVELADRCGVGEGKNVLIVGCGVGITACYLARKYGCRVVGIDLSELMVDRSARRAEKERISDKVGFRVADAQGLPFKDGTFDAVFCESVLAFVPDKQKAINEFARVTVPGGVVGFNEVTWLERPPPEIVSYLTRIMGSEFLMENEWQALLEVAGLNEIVARSYSTNIWSQWTSEVKQFEFTDFMKAWGKYWLQLFTSSATRRFTVEALTFPKSIFSLFRYFGYGIYTGRK